MTDIVDEVTLDTKYAKKIFLLRKFLPIIIVLAITGAICIMCYDWYFNTKSKYNSEVGDVLIEILSRKDDIPNLESFTTFINQTDNRQKELVDIKYISAAIESFYLENPQGSSIAHKKLNEDYLKKFKNIVKKLELIIDNQDYSKITTSFARLLFINMALNYNPMPHAMQIKVRNYLEYFSNPDQVFFMHANLLKIFFYHNNNQNDIAIEYAKKLLELNGLSLVVREQVRAFLSKN